jgi:hypothetical protein
MRSNTKPDLFDETKTKEAEKKKIANWTENAT